MFNLISTFLFTATGAFAIWLSRGFKGSFNDVMVRIDDQQSAKGRLQYYLGMAVWIFGISIASFLFTRPTETKVYRGSVNEKGEIVVEEVK